VGLSLAHMERNAVCVSAGTDLREIVLLGNTVVILTSYPTSDNISAGYKDSIMF
jgi:hypothetical protein